MRVGCVPACVAASVQRVRVRVQGDACAALAVCVGVCQLCVRGWPGAWPGCQQVGCGGGSGSCITPPARPRLHT